MIERGRKHRGPEQILAGELDSRARLQAMTEQLLEELVNIDSPTPETLGVNRVQNVIARELAALGCEVRFLPNPNPDVRSGDLLTATLAGELREFITFVSHADTVLGIEAAGKFQRMADGTAKGAGVIDNKGGVVVALQGLKHYLDRLKKEGRRPRFSIRIVISPNEEAGSIGFHDEFRRAAEDSVLVLGFEPALENGSIVESRRGNRWYHVHVKGQEAHAGRCKGEQINAAHDIALKIARLHRLNDPKKGLAVNVGHLEGGRGRFNVVCGQVSAKIDARFPSFEARDSLHRKIEKILSAPRVSSNVTGRSSETHYTIEDDCPPFSSTSASAPLTRIYLETIREIEGRKIAAEKSGGAGDVNYMSREGVVVLDGLGPCGGNMHTEDECVQLDSLASRSLALSALLDRAETALKKPKAGRFF